jgi:hypothetical protein
MSEAPLYSSTPRQVLEHLGFGRQRESLTSVYFMSSNSLLRIV